MVEKSQIWVRSSWKEVGGVVFDEGGSFWENMVTLETLIVFDNICFLGWFIAGKHTLRGALNDQQLEAGALLKGMWEHFKADKETEIEKELFLCFSLSQFSLLFHTQVSDPLSFTDAGFTWRALTDSKR